MPAIQRTVTAVVDEGSSGAAGTSSLNPMVKDLPPLAYFVDLRLNRPLLFTDAAISPEVVLEEINRLAGTAYDSVRIGWVRRGEEIEESILRPDRSAFLVAGFAAFALMLSMMVLVVAFLRVWIDSQLKALAIEFALGAKPADVIRRACGQLVPSLMFGAGIGAVSLLAVPPMSGGVISHSIGALLPDFVIAGGAVLCLLGVTTAPTLCMSGRPCAIASCTSTL